MIFKNKELIIFDLDGTLINSIPDITLALNIMLKHYNFSSLSIEQTTTFVGNGPRPLVNRALSCYIREDDISENFFEEALSIFMSAYKKSTCIETYLYPGVKETLTYLHERGYKLAICTNKPFEFIEPIIKKLGIKSNFTHWIGENSLPEKKPNAMPLIHLANKNNVSIERCLMIGDSKNDILAAKSANMECIGLNYGYNYNENIEDYGPTLVLDNFSELMELFK